MSCEGLFESFDADCWSVDLDALRKQHWLASSEAKRKIHLLAPLDAPPMPLSNVQFYERLVGIGIEKIMAWLGRSIALMEYQWKNHPDFEVFGRGIMASPYTPPSVLNDRKLQVRFPPQQLVGLGPHGVWSTPVNADGSRRHPIEFEWYRPTSRMNQPGKDQRRRWTRKVAA